MISLQLFSNQTNNPLNQSDLAINQSFESLPNDVIDGFREFLMDDDNSMPDVDTESECSFEIAESTESSYKQETIKLALDHVQSLIKLSQELDMDSEISFLNDYKNKLKI
ncbi:hypothetical protein A3Q56_07473 [Intoshia linei]|uniref:Uncharacterized protein n=1 Tax=Intoshia linei TaxID=1819745 RepID=A0A177ATX7_9BILA|nr:hypothetical protein A3Q56_07473 [Intoshia linei]